MAVHNSQIFLFLKKIRKKLIKTTPIKRLMISQYLYSFAFECFKFDVMFFDCPNCLKPEIQYIIYFFSFILHFLAHNSRINTV